MNEATKFTPNLIEAIGSIQGQLDGLRALLEDEAQINRVDGVKKALTEITPEVVDAE